MLHNSIYITFFKWKKIYGCEEQISFFQGLERGGGREEGSSGYNRVAQGGGGVFLVMEQFCILTVVVVISIYTYDKIA